MPRGQTPIDPVIDQPIRQGSLQAASRPAVGAMSSGAARGRSGTRNWEEEEDENDGRRGRDDLGELRGRSSSTSGNNGGEERSPSLVRKLLGMGVRRKSSQPDDGESFAIFSFPFSFLSFSSLSLFWLCICSATLATAKKKRKKISLPREKIETCSGGGCKAHEKHRHAFSYL